MAAQAGYLQERITNYLKPFLYRKAEWGKIQITRLVVIISATFVAFSNLASRNDFYFWNNDEEDQDSIIRAELRNTAPKVFHSLAMAPIADASEAISEEELARLKKEGEKATVLNQAVVGISNPSVEEFNESSQDVYVYTVKEGDTLGSIAQNYGINSNTIKWANGLDDSDFIKPGDQLFILPVSGVKYKIKSGDNIADIAKKYKAKEDEIIAFNDLPANGALKEGEEIIIPDGEIDEPTRRIAGTGQTGTSATGTAPTVGGADTSRRFNKQYYASGSHRFPWGWCTWYVASRRHVPWGGNAGTWLYHAKAYGANIGKTPKAGAIIVTNESSYGHVGIVEKVSGGSITISEMNYRGFGVVSKRTISAKAGVIKGFIY